MFEKLELVRMAQSMATYAAERQQLVARNIANADTPNYHATDLADFATTYESSDTMRTTRSGHFTGAESISSDMAIQSSGGASPNGNTVSVETEMMKAVEVKQQHDMALAIYRSTANVLRASLGRGS